MYRLITLLIGILILRTGWAFPNTDEKDVNLDTEGNSITVDNDDESRIINGTPASLGAYKYMCSLQRHDETGYSKFCGGALIHRKWIITAAHCIVRNFNSGNFSSFRVVCGMTHAYSFLYYPENSTAQILPVYMAYVHPNYTNVGRGYDIALIELSKEAQLNKYVQTIELPSPRYNPIGKWGLNMGWGYTDAKKGLASMELLVAPGQVLDRETCDKEHGWSITESQLCVFNKESSIFLGDSGGPHVHKSDTGKDIVVGLASFVNSFDVSKHAAVFTNVIPYIPWIRDVFRGNYYKYVPKPPTQ